MKAVKVSFDLLLPDDAKDEDIKKWLKFHLGISAHLNISLPLANMELYDGKPAFLTIKATK